MTVGAVVLAAGDGSRFESDEHKLRALVGDRPVLQHALEAVLGSGYDEVMLVVGDDDYDDVVKAAVEATDAGEPTVVHSPDWRSGQAHSVAVAIEHARSIGHEAIVIGLGDQPLVGTSTWIALRDFSDTPIAVASFAGQMRPPTRLASSMWDQVPTEGDAGARRLVLDNPDSVTTVASTGNPDDVDTVEALERVRQLYDDCIKVTELLGREPMGSFEVVVRSDTGAPVVLRNFPVLADGRPMPTLYWLCGERESMLIGRLEAAKGVRRAEADIGLESINAAHERYGTERDNILEESGVEPLHRPTGGVGGTRNGVKCLHAHYGYWLAGGDDPVGEWVDSHLGEVDTPHWPSAT